MGNCFGTPVNISHSQCTSKAPSREQTDEAKRNGFEGINPEKGWVDEKSYGPTKAGTGIAVAVKKSNPESPQGLEEWQAEVKFLGKFSHPNLVKLIGYCWEDKHFLLVYEYMQKGSLEKHLFRRGAEPLSWNLRLKIAIDAAKGLTFLHSSEKSVIYRDFKASNILLDGAYNAKLSDFGLAKFGPINGNSHITTRVMGTYGYAAPEYIATGHLYVKSDVKILRRRVAVLKPNPITSSNRNIIIGPHFVTMEPEELDQPNEPIKSSRGWATMETQFRARL
ncbi:hypothetical protein QYF36_004880 [Acer negundo]|nr:hypothetical protein QYF36_004880 [Acer negundo]